MSYTDELRGKGRERHGAGGGYEDGTAWVRWTDDYAWLEGRIVGTFDTKYGLACTFDVERVGGAELSGSYRDEEGKEATVRIEAGVRANIGTGSATLRGKLTAEDEGKAFHVAFEGWERGKENRYRVFSVIPLEERETKEEEPPVEAAKYAKPADDGLPF